MSFHVGDTPYPNVSDGGSTQGLDTSIYEDETLKTSSEKERDVEDTLHTQSAAMAHTL